MLFAAVCISIATMAQSVVLHTVQRGETVASVAKKYNISEEQLRKANPDVDVYFYVGMKLNIPVANTAESETKSHTKTEANQQVIGTVNSNSYSQLSKTSQGASIDQPTPTESYTRWKFYDKVGWSTLTRSGNESMNMGGCFFELGVSHYLGQNLPLSFGLAYTAHFYNKYNKPESIGDAGSTTDIDISSIQIPVTIGYDFGNKISVTPYIGAYIDYTISGKSEFKMSGEKMTSKLKDWNDYTKLQLGLKGGVKLHLGEFTLGAEYGIGLTKHDENIDESYWGLFIGYDF